MKDFKLVRVQPGSHRRVVSTPFGGVFSHTKRISPLFRRHIPPSSPFIKTLGAFLFRGRNGMRNSQTPTNFGRRVTFSNISATQMKQLGDRPGPTVHFNSPSHRLTISNSSWSQSRDVWSWCIKPSDAGCSVCGIIWWQGAFEGQELSSETDGPRQTGRGSGLFLYFH